MSAEEFVKELEASLTGMMTARQLASVAIEGTDLADDYPPGFAAELAASNSGSDPPRRSLSEWLAVCSPFAGGNPPRSREHLYFALVLVDDSLAAEFRRMGPAGNGFVVRCREFTDPLTHEQKEEWDRIVATSPTPADRYRLQAMAKAIDRRKAEFSLLVEARGYQLKRFNDDPTRPAAAAEERRIYKRFYLPILDAFENKHGPIVEEYWCSYILVGLVRTEGGNLLHFDGDFPEASESITDRCKDLRQKAEEFLTPKEYGYIVSDLYSLLSQWFAALDNAAQRGSTGKNTVTESSPAPLSAAEIEDSLSPYGERVAEVERRVAERMSRRGRRWYVVGTLIGLFALSIVFGVLAAVSLGNWQRLFEGAIFGAVGAIGSVLFRMNRGALRVNTAQGRGMVYVAAMVRPLMGSLFGAIVAAVALCGAFPIDVPNVEPDRFYLLAVLAFIAGFSERWAPNLLKVTARQLAPDDDERDEESAKDF